MALVNVVNMVVLDNPTKFGNPLQFEITFECLQELEDDLEWKVLYVGSAEDPSHDQILDEILVGPVPIGMNKFILQADGPNALVIPEDCILGVTVILVTCSYKEREFVRVGYYVNNEYQYDEQDLKDQSKCLPHSSSAAASGGGDYNDNDDNDDEGEEEDEADQQQQQQSTPIPPPPRPLDMNKVIRTILADKPRLTKFPILWTNNEDDTLQQQPQQQQQQQQQQQLGK